MDRILIADDEPRILHAYRTVLSGGTDATDTSALDAELFGNEPTAAPAVSSYDLTFCRQGDEAVEAVRQAQAQGQPYALAFLDVRMPPGPDGIEAARRIRDLDPDINIVIVTGYADASPRDIARQVAPVNKLFYVAKPFQAMEVQQFAAALVAKWRADKGLREANAALHEWCARLEAAHAELAATNNRLVEQSAERLALQEQLHQAQKMEALGRLAGGVAHEFNNLLAAMLGYGAMLVEDLPAGSELHDFADRIVESGNRAADIVRQILAFGRPQESAQQVIDARQPLDVTAKVLRATLPATVSLDVDATPEPVFVKADATQLSQIITNLVVNAREAIGEMPGRIRLSTAVDAVPPHNGPSPGDLRPRISTSADGATRLWIGSASLEGPTLRISVEDTGGGVERAVMERMFEPFFTTKPVGQGTGLGLAVVHGIAAAHGAALTVDSRVGQGTTVSILLPLAAAPGPTAATLLPLAAAPGPTAAKEAPPVAPKAMAKRVLIVEDEQMLAEMFERWLQRLGYVTEVAADGQAALDRLLRQDGAGVDAVLTDQTMPRLTGVELITALRQRGFDRPIILCTGYSASVIEDQARAIGASAFLRKPVDRAVLSALLADLTSRPELAA